MLLPAAAVAVPRAAVPKEKAIVAAEKLMSSDEGEEEAIVPGLAGTCL